MAAEPGRGDAPLAVAAFFMRVRGAQLHRPERPGGRVRPCGRRLGEQLELVHLEATLAVSRAQTVGAGVAAADDDHSLALRRDRLLGDGIAGVALVLLDEVVHGQVDALQLASRYRELARLLGAERQADRVELPA